MKKISLLFVLLIAVSTSLFATVIRIKVTGVQFKAKTVNAHVGDTIQWIWKDGIHTTTSTSVPTGATTWNKPIDMSHTKFRYILKVAGTYKYQCNFHVMFGMVGTIKVTAALAPGLQDFSINTSDASAIVNWKTASSKDVAYFSLQRSTDGDNFTEVAKVQPNVSNQYKFTDNNNTSSKYVYYQVEMVDLKGNHDLSEIKMFTLPSAAKTLITSISPNPVSSSMGHLMFQYNADKESTMVMKLYNQSGTLIKQAEFISYKGLNNGHFHLGDLSPGTYYVVCTLDATQEKHTIIVK